MIRILLVLFLFISLNSYSQPHKTPYISFSVDANNLLEIRDNDRMKYQINGLDFDIEVGAIRQKTTVYAFYGAFSNAYYYNYGFGLDYYFNILQNIICVINEFFHYFV